MDSSSVSSTEPHRAGYAADDRWQRKLLPFMVGSIVVMGIIFFVASIAQLYYLYQHLPEPDPGVAQALREFEQRTGPQSAADQQYIRWKALVLLEQQVVFERYHHLNAALLLRASTRYLGFVTGMILALVGAIFVLGKLREDTTNLEGSGSGLRLALATSSPGIVLTTLGTVLMGVTLIVPYEFNARDVPVYLVAPPPATSPLPPPVAPTKSMEELNAEEQALFGAPKKSASLPDSARRDEAGARGRAK